jgi:hypothetical protein
MWDEDNHQPLCRDHHSLKTAQEAKGAMAGAARKGLG